MSVLVLLGKADDKQWVLAALVNDLMCNFSSWFKALSGQERER